QRAGRGPAEHDPGLAGPGVRRRRAAPAALAADQAGLLPQLGLFVGGTLLVLLGPILSFVIRLPSRDERLVARPLEPLRVLLEVPANDARETRAFFLGPGHR